MENDIVKLIVSGAGVSEANTEYTESGKRDNVRRWESSNGYEMFRFNVPGKGKSSGRRWFFGKIGNKAVYYIKDNSNVPPKEGWSCHPTGQPPVPTIEYVYKNGAPKEESEIEDIVDDTVKKEEEEKAAKEAEEKAKKEAEEKAKKEAEEKAKREAEEKAKREAEEKAKREAEEKAKREAEEKAAKEEEERMKREAEEKAKREAEEKARKEAEEKAAKEAEEKAKREAEEKAAKEAEEKAKREAEERMKREAEEKAAKEAEEKARKEAEEKARKEAEEKARKEAEEKAAKEEEERRKREAEEKAAKEEEERRKREAEEKAAKEAEEKARKEAEEKAKREAAEKAAKEAEEKAAREAEEKAAKEAEEKAKKEAEEKAKEAEERMKKEAEERMKREAEEKAAKEAAEKKPVSALERLLQITPTMTIQPVQAPAEEEAEEPVVSPSERMLCSGVLAGAVSACAIAHDMPVFTCTFTRDFAAGGRNQKEQWTVEIAYSRFRALHNYYRHAYPAANLPKLPVPVKKTNVKALEAAAAEMNGFLQGVLNLRNSGLVDTAFANEKVPAEEALLSDVLQMVLRGYGTHNPLGQKEGGVRVKLVLDNAVPFGFLKDEDRIALQNDCCADCGARIGGKQGLFKKDYRYCEYSHYYYCLNCHSNSTFIIPGRLVLLWDFKSYPVANVCAEYLRSIFDQPLICVSSVNPELMEKNATLKRIRELRSRLSFMYDYVNTCKQREELMRVLEPRLYFMTGTEMLSLKDFLDIKNGTLLPWLERVVAVINKHITQDCVLCKAKGFYCEICKKGPEIFPFQFESTVICRRCNSVYHKSCYTGMENCPKCKRIHERNLKEKEELGDFSEKLVDEERH
ncbi:hypothetical protein WA577_005071, partial [Blastocystis sp. JDR]